MTNYINNNNNNNNYNENNAEILIGVGFIIGLTDCGSADARAFVDWFAYLDYPSFSNLQDWIEEYITEDIHDFNKIIHSLLTEVANRRIDLFCSFLYDLGYDKDRVEVVNSHLWDNLEIYCDYLDSSFYIEGFDDLNPSSVEEVQGWINFINNEIL